MCDDNDEFFDISSLVDEVVRTQINNGNSNETELSNVLLSELQTELNSLEDYYPTPSVLNKLEQCFVKLSQLLPTASLASSHLLIPCCLSIVTRLLEMSFLSQNMEHSPSKSDEYYTLAMDALNTRINLEYLQGNEELPSDVHAMYTRSFLSLAREVIRCRNRAMDSLSVQQWNLRTSFFEPKYKSLLKILLSFIDKQLKTDDDISYYLYFFITLSDDTTLIPTLVGCGLPQYLKTWLVTLNNTNQFENSILCEPILYIINNVARHEDGSNVFKNLEMNQTLTDFRMLYEHTLSKSNIAVHQMAYALIVTPDELKSITVLHDVIDFLLLNINLASRSSTMRTDTAHMSEYLIALARLVVNDNAAQYIIDTCKTDTTTDELTFFDNLFEKYNNLTPDDSYLKHLSRIALFNIFSSFSYQTTAQKLLSSNQKFVETIKNASRHNNEQDIVVQPYLLQHLSSIKQAAEAILINLDLYKDEDVVPAGISPKSAHSRVMISYSHKEKTFCRELARALRSHSIDLWVDEDGHCRSDDCWEEIAMAIKYASFILVIVSPSYCQSLSCRKEATYADKRKKPLIALYPNADTYEPDEWLDIRLTGTYVRFGGSGQKSFDNCITRLLEYIQPKEGDVANAIVPKNTSSMPPPPPPTTTKVQKPSEDITKTKRQSLEIVPLATTQAPTTQKPSIHDWTKIDVQTWFLVERQLLPQLYQLYAFVDGDSLLEYAKHFIREHEQDAKQQYEKLHKRLQHVCGVELYDNHYTDLVCSMKKLLLAYDQPRVSATKTTKQSSSTCLIL